MNAVVRFCLLILFYVGYISSSFFTVQGLEKSCFRAAVFEHVQQLDNTTADARHKIELNLKVYENVAKEAALNVSIN